jgi:hypothetical protein
MSHKVAIAILVAICLVLVLTGCTSTQQTTAVVSQTSEQAEPQAMTGSQTVSTEVPSAEQQPMTETERTVERMEMTTVGEAWRSPRLGPSGRP